MKKHVRNKLSLVFVFILVETLPIVLFSQNLNDVSLENESEFIAAINEQVDAENKEQLWELIIHENDSIALAAKWIELKTDDEIDNESLIQGFLGFVEGRLKLSFSDEIEKELRGSMKFGPKGHLTILNEPIDELFENYSFENFFPTSSSVKKIDDVLVIETMAGRKIKLNPDLVGFSKRYILPLVSIHNGNSGSFVLLHDGFGVNNKMIRLDDKGESLWTGKLWTRGRDFVFREPRFYVWAHESKGTVYLVGFTIGTIFISGFDRETGKPTLRFNSAHFELR